MSTTTGPTTGPASKRKKPIREASTLVIAARDLSLPQDTDHSFDYRLLLLQRQGREDQFAGASVFPGGVVDPADFSSRWYELYRDIGVVTGDDFGWGHMRDKPRPRPITAQREKGLLPNEVAFRICAIRETFEESGVLIAGRRGDVLKTKSLMNRKGLATATDFGRLGLRGGGPFPAQEKLRQWQKYVHDDASRFLEMCLELGVYPDVWSLYQLSTIMTPRYLPKRYDTMFYICSMEAVPEVKVDQKEIVDHRWLTPVEGLRLHFRKEIELFFPQLNECARLLELRSLREVQRYAESIMDEGMEPQLVKLVRLADANIRVLPGDDCYPRDCDDSGPSIMQLDESEAENFSRCENFNRITMTDDGHFKMLCNIRLPYQQRSPSNINSRDWTTDSKL